MPHEWRVLDLFSGIGGFSLGLERAGMRTVAFCEVNPYCRKVLERHWPDVPIHADVRTLKGTDVENITLICGGFPCQDISIAAAERAKGIGETRSGLWSEYARLIGEIRPDYALVENVPRLLSGDNGGWFAVLLGDLAVIGYDAEWFCLSAAALGAPHVRNRVFVLAYPHGVRPPSVRARPQKADGLAIRHCWTHDSHSQLPSSSQLFARPDGDIPGGLHGVSDELDRIEALGNAVVPQVVEVIGRALITSQEAYTGEKAKRV